MNFLIYTNFSLGIEMPTIVENCPRCKANDHTFDIVGGNPVVTPEDIFIEAFSICRACNQSVVFLIKSIYGGASLDALMAARGNLNSENNQYYVDGYINISHTSPFPPPEHLPDEVNKVFIEATRCHAIGCWNAAGAMFRSTIDVATKELLIRNEHTQEIKYFLAKRLAWLFEKGYIPMDLKELSNCIREDGNHAVHEVSLTKIDAEDLLEFTTELLERIYTQPKKLQSRIESRNIRRNKGND